uniref:Fibronectin type-III domain-containing protein n=1 Tax=Panagrolaimus davidi TaxID=227884 RepID=A0A914Q0P6_9BILA
MFEKCNVIEGSLKIQIEECGKAEEFTKAFGNIREITGYLLIRFSPTFTSLHMFKNLEIIHGEELVNGRYALSVMELENLRQLFKQNITIKNGLINFESNPKLCFNKITEFVKSVGLENNITENGISKYSNGENAICEAPVLLQNLNDNSDERIFTLSFTGFKTTNINHTKLLGYKIYYKKVDKIDPDMEIGDDNNACDRWESKFVTNAYARFENLEINTIYAYYIHTKVITHPEAKNAVSKLLFHKTPFKTPEMPRIKRYEAIGPNKILLEWDPPIKPNGIITHYTVMWNAKSIGNNGIGHDSFENNCTFKFNKLKFFSQNFFHSEIQKCHNIEATESEESRNEGTEFEDSVLNVIYPPPNIRKPIEEYYFDQYSLLENDPETFIEKCEEKYPEIINENKTYGRSNISTTRVILSGLFHYTEYYIQIIACQDITVPENFCSKQAASRIIRTHPIPENNIVDLNTINVLPYLINGTEQEDSRIINWKIPENPNGAILGFRYKISTTNFEIDRQISKEDYKKSNGILIQGLQNGLYSAEIRTISSAGISEANVKKEFIKIHVFNWEIFLYKWLPLVVVVSGFIFVVCRFCMEKGSKKHTQKVIPSEGQKILLL